MSDTSQPVESEGRGYAYDNIGNREQATDWDAANSVQKQLTYTANQLNQYELITADNSQADEMPSYDDDGNMTRYEGKVYTYNAENRLVVVEPELPAEGDSRLEFVYDYMGRRVSKKISSYSSGSWSLDSALLFLYDGWNLLAELDENGVAQAAYVWGLDLSQSLQGAGGVGGLLAWVDNGVNESHHYFYDGNGNVGQLVDSDDGTLAEMYEYDPYGNLLASAGGYVESNPFRFSTKFFDNETGFYYYGYRYYVPEVGRWLSRDPIEEYGGLNLYSVAYNDLVNGYDVNGLFVDRIIGKIIKWGGKKIGKKFLRKFIKDSIKEELKDTLTDCLQEALDEVVEEVLKKIFERGKAEAVASWAPGVGTVLDVIDVACILYDIKELNIKDIKNQILIKKHKLERGAAKASKNRLDQARSLAQKYGLGDCIDCAEDILQNLGPDDIKVIKVRTQKGTSDFLGVELPDGSIVQLSGTGKHVALEVDGKVVDNVFEGVSPGEFVPKIHADGPTSVSVLPASEFFTGNSFNSDTFRKWLQQR
jgi:RHS repeat-associated protein